MRFTPFIPPAGLLLLAALVARGAVGELESLQADPKVEAIIRGSPSLQAGGIRFAKLGGRPCLVVTHSAVARDGSFGAALEAEKIAALEGRKELVAFLQGRKVTGRDFLETTNVSKDEVDHFSQTFRSLTTSEVDGSLRGVRTAGSWKVKGEPRHFVIQILDLPGKFTASATAVPAPPEPQVGTPADVGRSVEAPVAQPGMRIVTVSGRYAFLGNVDAARARALVDASQNAIREVMGEWVTAQELARNSTKLESQILSKTEGFISTYKIMSEGVKGTDQYEVVIEAAVVQGKLKSEAVAIGLLKAQLGLPKVSIIAIETDGERAFRETTAPLLNLLTREFVESGITPTDMQQAMNKFKVEEPERWEQAEKLMRKVRDPLEKEFDVQAFGRLGLAADLIVLGMSRATPLGKDSDGVLERYECTVTLRILDANTADVLGTVTDSQTSRADNRNTALINVCKKLVPTVHELIPQTLRKWQDMAGNGRRIPVVLKDIPSPQAGREIRRGLAKILRVQQAEVRIQQQNLLEAEVVFKGTPSDFVGALEDWLDENLKGWDGGAGSSFRTEQRGGKVFVTFTKKNGL